jgi:hypothetical protein
VASFDPTAIGLAGVQLAQIAVGVLGVLPVTSEYATGMIRTSMVAVPRRLPVLWGKAIVLALTAPLLFVPATFATFLVSQSVLSREQLGTSLHQPGVARAVLGSALYLTAVGLLRLGLGALLRNTAGAIASLFGVLFGLQIVVGFLPASPSPTCGPTRPRSHPGPGSACLPVHGHPARAGGLAVAPPRRLTRRRAPRAAPLGSWHGEPESRPRRSRPPVDRRPPARWSGWLGGAGR